MANLYTENDDDQVVDQQQTDESNDIDFPHPVHHKKPDGKTKKDFNNERKLDATVKAAQRILFKTTTIFPFDLFPDEIIIDENKIDIIHGNFFFSKDIYSIPIQNVSGVNSSFDIFFGQLRIEAWGLNKVPQPIRFLRKGAAITARRIISGLIMTHNNEIDLKNIPLIETKIKLEEIGRAREHI